MTAAIDGAISDHYAEAHNVPAIVDDDIVYLGVPLERWRAVAAQQLDEQTREDAKYLRYYDGEHDLDALPGESREIFRRLMKESRTNWCELIVDSVAERLIVQGFRFADEATSALVWRIWQASRMDADAEMVQTDALACGHSYVSVWPDPDSPEGVTIAPEHPSEVTVISWPGARRRRLVGYKRFGDPVGGGIEVLATATLVVVWWQPDGELPARRVQVNPTGRVPFHELTPAPRTKGAPRSELHSVLPIQDRINTTIYNRMVATDFGAFRQLTATGLRLARRTVENEDGTTREVTVPPFDVGADRLLVNENPEGRFGAIPESNLRGYLDSDDKDVQHLAAITKTPPHYLLGQMINIPASGMKAAETGLVAKVRRRATHLGEGWEDVARDALHVIGAAGADDMAAEVAWRDFETRSEAELSDALTKQATLDVPQDVLWERLGASPQQITEWHEMNRRNGVVSARLTAAALGATDPYAALLAGAQGGGGGG
jgi:hypothetical protein